MGKLKWVTKNISFSCQDPPKFTKSVSFSCYPFSLSRFGPTEIQLLTARINVETSS